MSRAKAKRGPGKPKKEISPEDMAQAEGYAFEGHQNGTICDLLDWPTSWLETRKDIRKRLTKKRAERKVWLRGIQNKQAVKVPAMAIFLGKNELDQADKQELKHQGKIVVEIVKN
jgi:hypothetical protein